MSGAYAALLTVSTRVDYLVQAEGEVQVIAWENGLREKVVQLREGVMIDDEYHNNLVDEHVVIELAYDIENAFEYCHYPAMSSGMSRALNLCCSTSSGFGRRGDLQEDLHFRIDQLLKDIPPAAVDDARKKKQAGPSSTTTPEVISQVVQSPTHSISSSSDGNGVMDGDDIQRVLSLLLTGNLSLSVIPIVGMGGIGKTTLARKVFSHRAVRDHFDICLWTTVSQQYSVKDLLRSLLGSTYIGRERTGDMNSMDILVQLHKKLIGRRYLIVLDDVWDEKVWDGLRNAFPSDKNGSRVIITTRLSSVATYVLSSGSIFHVQGPSTMETQERVITKSGLNDSDLDNPRLQEVVRDVAIKFHDIPLAIDLVAGLLKENKVDVQIELLDAVKNQNVDVIIGLSYNILPPHLKPCVVYLGLFPQSEAIPVEKVYLLWMAEGLVSTRGVAEIYLRELADRNLVCLKNEHVSATGGNKFCTLDKLVLEFCISKGKDTEFFGIIDSVDSFEACSSKHRVSVQLNNSTLGGERFPYINVANHIRSLLLFSSNLSSLWTRGV